MCVWIVRVMCSLKNAVVASEGKSAGLYQLELAKYFYVRARGRADP